MYLKQLNEKSKKKKIKIKYQLNVTKHINEHYQNEILQTKAY